MMGLGIRELLIMPLALLGSLVPVALLIGIVLIYKKVSEIERMLVVRHREDSL